MKKVIRRRRKERILCSLHEKPRTKERGEGSNRKDQKKSFFYLEVKSSKLKGEKGDGAERREREIKEKVFVTKKVVR